MSGSVRRRMIASGLAVAALAVVAGGCGGDDDADGASGGGAKGGKAIDVGAIKGAKGEITYCTLKDTDGGQKTGIKAFNRKYADQGLRARLLEFPESPDEQRNQYIQRLQAKSSECDLFEADVVWTAEFASQKWLLDMTPYIRKRASQFVPSTLQTVKYQGRYWGVPRVTDSGLLYYRSDKVSTPPTSWQDTYRVAARTGGIAYQGAAYEGLTCDFLEIAFAAGGKVLSDDGAQSEINSPQNVKALQFMVDGIKSGAASKAVTTYQEEQARRAFEAGRASLMRNWPYAYALGQRAPKTKGKVEVVPLPPFEGGGKAGILGGHNLVVSAFSKNPGGALALIEYFTSPEEQEREAVEYSKAPVLTATYDDPQVKKALPFATELRDAVQQAKSRPVSPVYSQISQAISKNVNAALSGSVSAQDALKKADDEIGKALSTF